MSVELCSLHSSVCFFANFCVILGENQKEVGRVLGLRIALLRRSAGMSQQELAEKLKISASAVGMYEQGRREPSVQILSDMARLFGVSIDFLVTGKATTPGEQEEMNHLLLQRVQLMDTQLEGRRVRPFSREELAVLFAAMLMEP